MRPAVHRPGRAWRARCAASAIALLVAAATHAPAAQAQVACTTSAAPLGFGVYDTLTAAANRVNGAVTLACRLVGQNAAKRIAYTVSLGAGSGSGTQAKRTMLAAGTADTLGYLVYLGTESPGTVWGDGTGGTVAASGSMTVNANSDREPRTIPMIGVLPPLQQVGAGVYGDTLTVTISWN